jgi:hypothetical protein
MCWILFSTVVSSILWHQKKLLIFYWGLWQNPRCLTRVARADSVINRVALEDELLYCSPNHNFSDAPGSNITICVVYDRPIQPARCHYLDYDLAGSLPVLESQFYLAESLCDFYRRSASSAVWVSITRSCIVKWKKPWRARGSLLRWVLKPKQSSLWGPHSHLTGQEIRRCITLLTRAYTGYCSEPVE